MKEISDKSEMLITQHIRMTIKYLVFDFSIVSHDQISTSYQYFLFINK